MTIRFDRRTENRAEYGGQISQSPKSIPCSERMNGRENQGRPSPHDPISGYLKHQSMSTCNPESISGCYFSASFVADDHLGICRILIRLGRYEIVSLPKINF
jgi:hypothetical protein